jgi:hypothetical protein
MFFSFPGAAAGVSVDTLVLKGATPSPPSSLFQSMACLGCTLPVFYVTNETPTTTIENFKILNFNTPASTPSFYAPFFKFDLSQPYSTITPKVTLTNLQVDTFTGD